MIASLVVTTTEAGVTEVPRALARLDGVELGSSFGTRLAVLVEAGSSAELRARFEAMEDLAGVERIELVMFQFPSQHEEQPQ